MRSLFFFSNFVIFSDICFKIFLLWLFLLFSIVYFVLLLDLFICVFVFD